MQCIFLNVYMVCKNAFNHDEIREQRLRREKGAKMNCDCIKRAVLESILLYFVVYRLSFIACSELKEKYWRTTTKLNAQPN